MKTLSLLLAALCLATSARAQVPVTRIFIVRHADRAGQADELTAKGLARAQELKRVLTGAGIDSIYSTNFVRTRKTAQPLATLRGLPVDTYSDIPDLVSHILKGSSGKSVLVVGHSNTLDDIIHQCGCKPPATIAPEMPLTQYDHLFLVLVHSEPRQKRTCELLHMKYGAATR